MLIFVGFLNNGIEKKIEVFKTQVSNVNESKGGDTCPTIQNCILLFGITVSEVMQWFSFLGYFFVDGVLKDCFLFWDG